MSIDPAALRSFVDLLVPLYELLLPEPLSDQERKKRSANLFPRAPEQVRAAGRSLLEDDQLFSGEPVDGAALLQQQEVADALHDLRGHLGLLHRLCGDTFIVVQE